MIVWLASYPRSGNTLFRIVLKQVYGLDSYSVYGDRDITRMGAAELIGHKGLSTSIDAMRTRAPMFIVKTHGLGYQTSDPAIYLVRDVRDALVSHAHYHIDIEGGNDFVAVLQRLAISKPLFGGWSENARSWTVYPSTVVVKYEDMVEDPVGVVSEALAQAGIMDEPIGVHGRIPTFEELHAKWPEFFRRGRVRQWESELSPAQEEMIWQAHGAMMTYLGYER